MNKPVMFTDIEHQGGEYWWNSYGEVKLKPGTCMHNSDRLYAF